MFAVKNILSKVFGLGLGALVSVSAFGPKPYAAIAETNPLAKSDVSEEQKQSLNARWELAYFLFQNQEYQTAAIEFEKIRKYVPHDASLLALLGSCYSMSGKWEQGEKALLQAHTQNPDDDDINGLLGQFYLSQGQGSKATAFLEKSLVVNPDQEDVRAKLAHVYLNLGDIRNAKKHFEALLESQGALFFADAELNFEYGKCLIELNDSRNAMPYLQTAYQLQPSDGRIAEAYGYSLYTQNYFIEAAQVLEKIRQEKWVKVDLYLQIGESHYLSRNWEMAEKIWLEGLKRFPSSYAMMSRLIDYYIGIAMPNRAARVVVFGEKLNQGNPGNLLLQTQLKRKLSNYAAAWKALERLKRQACAPMTDEAMWEEAQLYFETGKYGNCQKVLDLLLLTQHRNGEVHLLKAKLALLGGDKRVAQNQLRLAKEIEPQNWKVYSFAREAFEQGEVPVEFSSPLSELSKPLASLNQR